MFSINYPCIKQDQTRSSGLASILSISHYYKFFLTPQQITRYLETEKVCQDSFYLVAHAKQIGFNAVPLEGNYDQLEEVPRPNIVVLDSNAAGKEHFVILYEYQKDSVIIGDPKEGKIKTLSREEFCQRWTGDCILIEPEHTDFTKFHQEIKTAISPWNKAKKPIFNPPHGPKVIYLFLIGLLGFLFFFQAPWKHSFFKATPWYFTSFVALGIALLASAWSWFFVKYCSTCTKAGNIIGGLPLGCIGTVFYTVTIAFGLLFSWKLPFLIILGLASGTHAYLLSILQQHKIKCFPCIITALAAFGATIVFSISHLLQPKFMLSLGTAILVSVISSRFLIRGIRHYAFLKMYYETQQLAKRTLEQADSWGNKKQISLIVYKKKNCSACLYWSNILRPALEEEFEDLLWIEERDTIVQGSRITTPLLILNGNPPIVFIGLDPDTAYEQFLNAVEQMQNSKQIESKVTGFYMIDNIS